ncbi:hypothetical protein B1748_30640 [Paenibacillus sp. MY03]|uniref:hypothetical protein n=1 Tax=Paenibacillus sp. MY03 TaxID=302980 RepID=UPI000B3D1BE4|nr:hypothetical protein [Paenibacillus sp. MY03]OUS69699.1 hypothetical protein B1748_30640 [Paenibacillus sp. MY03]
MKEFTRQLWEVCFQKVRENSVFDDGLNNLGRPGHTRDASKAAEAHDGRTTTAYYMMGTALGLLDKDEGLDMLEAVQKLQITDQSSPYYGCFFWYREESEMHDSNAAFFTLTSLVVLRLKLHEQIPGEHLPILDEMMELGRIWFAREIGEAKLYYPNKILSDGALLLALSRLTNHREHYELGVQFFERWLDYTARRGWGWGENISSGYIRICINALNIAIAALRSEHHELAVRLDAIIEELLEYVRFHGGYAFVPAIRTYNFKGIDKNDGLLQWIAGTRKDVSNLVLALDSMSNATECMSDVMSVWLSEERIEAAAAAEPDNGGALSETDGAAVPRERTERVFDDSFAYSWIGKQARLGSLNRFPVIPGSYQWPTWGLAWQTFPAAYLIEGEQLAYPRWFVDDGDKHRTHPAFAKETYLSPALFRESWYPNIQMRCTQKERALIMYRGMLGVNNRAAEIADEWIVHRFAGEVSEERDAEGRRWIVLHYRNAQVLFASLRGISHERITRSKVDIEIIHEVDEAGETVLKLRQQLYGDKLDLVQHPQLEAGWLVYVIDDVRGDDDARKWLQDVSVADDVFCDGEVPREIAYLEKRRIALMHRGELMTELLVDPHELCGR